MLSRWRQVLKRDNATVRVCETYSDRLVSYCDAGDVFCDAGGDRKVHGSYIGRYGDDALKFIADRYGKAAKSSDGSGDRRNRTSTSTVSGSTSTAAPTASSTDSPAASGGSSAAPSAGRGTVSAASGEVSGSIYLALSLVFAAALQAL